jgi:hypothetical protein
MEDTIGYVDRTYFGLYNQVEGFEYATVAISDNDQLISRVTFSENGFLKDTLITNDFSILENTRSKIDQIIKENQEKIETIRQVKITANNGNTYQGDLEGFSKNHLYLFSEKNFLLNQDTEFKFKIRSSRIDEVLIIGRSNYLTPVLWGAGIGFATGVLAPIGLSAMVQETLDPDSEPEVEFASELLVSGFVCAIIGAGIGYVIGLLTAEDDVPIKFNSDRSVLRLSDYAIYNFRNLKTFDENYYEIK